MHRLFALFRGVFVLVRALYQEGRDGPVCKHERASSACLATRSKKGFFLSFFLGIGGDMRIAMVNQKGGVGKTTATICLAAVAAARGERVLVVDIDPQANATDALGAAVSEDAPTVFDALTDGSRGIATQAIIETRYRGVDVVPADTHLASFESANVVAAEQRLKKVLDAPDISAYDLILMDCPPSLGALSTGALVASDKALIVTEPAVSGSKGVDRVLDTIDTVAEHYNDRLDVAGVLINRVPPRSTDADFRLNELENALGKVILHPVIPNRVAIPTAQGTHQPITEVAPDVAELFVTILDMITKE